ncbi:MAG: hypothetical protein K5989_12755 [Lachnospiraceae bacterium]|nr:hypothetical protein [Lachnospiraceae bacterium]
MKKYLKELIGGGILLVLTIVFLFIKSKISGINVYRLSVNSGRTLTTIYPIFKIIIIILWLLAIFIAVKRGLKWFAALKSLPKKAQKPKPPKENAPAAPSGNRAFENMANGDMANQEPSVAATGNNSLMENSIERRFDPMTGQPIQTNKDMSGQSNRDMTGQPNRDISEQPNRDVSGQPIRLNKETAGQRDNRQKASGQNAPGQTAPSPVDSTERRFDPMTGQPIQPNKDMKGQRFPGQTAPGQTAPGQTAPGTAASRERRFDPMTGQPIRPNKDMTGQPISLNKDKGGDN